MSACVSMCTPDKSIQVFRGETERYRSTRRYVQIYPQIIHSCTSPCIQTCALDTCSSYVSRCQLVPPGTCFYTYICRYLCMDLYVHNVVKTFG